MELLNSPAAVWTAALLIAGIFVPSAASKVRALDEFTGIVENYALVPQRLVRPVALALPVLETLAGVCVLVVPTRRLGGLLAVSLLLIFALAMAINLVRGRSEIDCGCFIGRQKERIGWPLVARNLLLVVLAVPLLLPPPTSPLAPMDLLTVACAAASLLALYSGFSRLAGLAPMARLRRT